MDVRYLSPRGSGVRYYLWLLLLVGLVAGGCLAARDLALHGHQLTGMSNRVVWGLPHVFAVFLILAASGAAHIASLGSLSTRTTYQPLTRLSALTAAALLVGGVAVLVLDLGRAERVLIVMRHFNPGSIFAWNVILYSGFVLIMVSIVCLAMERRFVHLRRPLAWLSVSWRVVLTCGTGSIFAVLTSREFFGGVLMVPLFIAVSLSAGLAVFTVVLASACRWAGQVIGEDVLEPMARMQCRFIAGVLAMVLLHLLGIGLSGELRDAAAFILRDGGVYTALFWIVQVLLGGAVPLALLWQWREGRSVLRVAFASRLVILGSAAQLYVLIIAGQAYPQRLVSGYEVLGGALLDGQVAPYAPTVVELALGLGGLGLSLLLLTVGLRVLPLLPERVGDP